jgi:nucleoside-diphosphate-sugar epimerase
MTKSIHTVLGAGQVGRKLADELLAMGHEVRIVRRGAAGGPRPGLEWRSGDVTDRHFLDGALKGSSVVYSCVNPPDYGRWEGVLDPLMDAVREGAIRAEARLVTLDCLYMVGRPERAPFDEDTPMRPCSKKGEMRARQVEKLFEASARGELQFTSGRAADFFGPESPLSTVLSPDVLERMASGKSAFAFGDPDLPRSYSYTPDVARGLALLGTREEALGKVWHLPVASQTTSRDLLERAFAALGRAPKIARIPRFAFTAAAPFSPMVRALREMLYQWEIPYAMDDGRFRETFGMEPTPTDEAVRATVAPYLRAAGMTAAEAA